MARPLLQGDKSHLIKNDLRILSSGFKKLLEGLADAPIFALQITKWSVGQGVKTPPFHGGITGSIPVRSTNLNS